MARLLARPSRRRLVSIALTASAALLGVNPDDGLAKKRKKKDKKKDKKEAPPPPPTAPPPADTPCSPDPHCGHEGECHNGVCFCPSHEQFCGGTCCSPLWFGQEVCVDNVCCHPSSACPHECCPGHDRCIAGACCPERRSCLDANAKDVCCAPDERCARPAEHLSNLACCPVARLCPPRLEGGVYEGMCCKPEQTCCDDQCCDPDRPCCNGQCCDVGQACINGSCERSCPQRSRGSVSADADCCANPLTIRGEACCPQGDLDTHDYACGPFRCHKPLSGTGPGACDLWCNAEAGESTWSGGTVDHGIPVPGVPGVYWCCAVSSPTGLVCVWP